MIRLRCLDCHDGRHCRHSGYVPAGTILQRCRCLDCDPQPIQARLFSHALVENDLGADIGREPLHFELVAGRHAVLFAAGPDHRIHRLLQDKPF